MFIQKLIFKRWVIQVGLQFGLNWALSIEIRPFTLFEVKLLLVRFGIHTMDMKPYIHNLQKQRKAKNRKRSNKRAIH